MHFHYFTMRSTDIGIQYFGPQLTRIFVLRALPPTFLVSDPPRRTPGRSAKETESQSVAAGQAWYILLFLKALKPRDVNSFQLSRNVKSRVVAVITPIIAA